MRDVWSQAGRTGALAAIVAFAALIAFVLPVSVTYAAFTANTTNDANTWTAVAPTTITSTYYGSDGLVVEGTAPPNSLIRAAYNEAWAGAGYADADGHFAYTSRFYLRDFRVQVLSFDRDSGRELTMSETVVPPGNIVGYPSRTRANGWGPPGARIEYRDFYNQGPWRTPGGKRYVGSDGSWAITYPTLRQSVEVRFLDGNGNSLSTASQNIR